ncbi:MAG: TetR/AcrR family transcriptional regulator [Polyangiales bacterium]
MPERKSSDPAQLLALLWRNDLATKAGRGPRPTLRVEDVVQSAIVVADAEGIDGLTIRKVAERLHVAPMSIYTYVPGKAELLTLMLDAAHRDMPRTKPTSDHWRARIEAVAADNRQLLSVHPWIIALPPNRPPLGPGTLGKYEHELGALIDTGLDDVQLDAALTLVLGFVEACAHAAARSRAAVAESAQTDAEWWDNQEPHLTNLFDPAQYPLGVRIGSASSEAMNGTYNENHAYHFGLERILDGLAVLITGTRS